MSDEKPNTDTPPLTKPPGFDLDDIAWASILGDRGHLDEAIALLEKHADASDEIFYAESTRFKMLRAARDGDWSLGLGLWESHCERLVRRNTFLDERNVDGYALFFLGYANEWLAEGNVEEALRWARKARRLAPGSLEKASPAVALLLAEADEALDPPPAP